MSTKSNAIWASKALPMSQLKVLTELKATKHDESSDRIKATKTSSIVHRVVNTESNKENAKRLCSQCNLCIVQEAKNKTKKR